MKTGVKIPFLFSVLIAFLSLMLAGRVTAQTFTNLHSFPALYSTIYGATNSDGATPTGGLILSGNILYGTSSAGGGSGNGTVFALNTDGTGFTNLHNFTGPPYTGTAITNSEGASPYAGLILSGQTLYGTAPNGGNSSKGTVFAVNTNGSSFTNLHNFTGSDGDYPYAGLILSSNTLYGTTYGGGSAIYGTVFAINTDGSGFTNLHNFIGSDGASLYAGLVLQDSILYGAAFGGGNSGGYGTLFAVNTDGTGFTNLHKFTSSEGFRPRAGLTLSGNILYGTTQFGGSGHAGTVFKVNTDGTGFTNLHNFTGSDGASPYAALILLNNTLYGTTALGGSVFAVDTDGTGFTTLHSFTGGSDGASPYAGLILSSNILYGTSTAGGGSGHGTVFSIFIQPQLTIISSETNVILTWPTNYSGFTLQSATNLASPVWTTNSPAPVVINGQNTVTNPISGNQQFFRLSQ